MRVTTLMSIAITGALCAELAFGETPQTLLPSSVNPGVIQNQLQQSTETENIPKPLQKTKSPEEEKAESELSKIHFKLTKVILEGNTVFSTEELEKIYQPSLGKEISVADLQKMVHEITIKYRNEGYVLSKAILPAQKIENGVVKVQVVEGFVSQVNTESEYERLKPLVQSYGDPVLNVKPLQLNTLEHNLLLVNDLPGIQVKSVLIASKTVPAGADLLISTEYTPVNAYISYDNYGTRYLGPKEITFAASANSIIFPGDSNSFRWVTATIPQEMQFGEYFYTKPIWNKGWKFTIYGNYTQTKPEYLLQPLEIVGRSVASYIDTSYPFIRQRTKNLYGHLMFNYQNVSSTILETPFYQDRIRSLTMGGSFDVSDNWFGYSGFNNGSLDLDQGFIMMGANMHFLQSRPRGRARYTRAILNISRTQYLSQPLSLFLSIRGQYAFNPLLTSVQVACGGSDIGRGYDPAEITGDRGLMGKFEVRIDARPELKYLQGIQLYAFYDAGEVLNLDTFDLPAKLSLTSTGLGARIYFMPHLNANLYIAQPLTRQVASLQAGGFNGSAVRGFFQITLNS